MSLTAAVIDFWLESMPRRRALPSDSFAKNRVKSPGAASYFYNLLFWFRVQDAGIDLTDPWLRFKIPSVNFSAAAKVLDLERHV